MVANVSGYLLNVGVPSAGVIFGTPTSSIVVLSLLVAAVLGGILAEYLWWGRAPRRQRVPLALVRRAA